MYVISPTQNQLDQKTHQSETTHKKHICDIIESVDSTSRDDRDSP